MTQEELVDKIAEHLMQGTFPENVTQLSTLALDSKLDFEAALNTAIQRVACDEPEEDDED